MKKFILFFLVIPLIIGILFSGCSQQAATTTSKTAAASTTTSKAAPATTSKAAATTAAASTTTSKAAATTTTAASQTIELVVSDHNPAPSGPGQSIIYWADQVNTLSNGRLHLTVHSGGSLLTGEEVYRGVQTDIADIGHYVIDTREGFALNLVATLPFIGWPKQHVEDMYTALLNEFPEMQAEWQGVTILSEMFMPPTHIHNNKKAVTTPADLKGMKIMGAENVLNETMQAAGATAVQLDIADMATSLNSGLIDGVMNHYGVINVFGALEFLPYHTTFGEGGINMTPMYLIMNTDKLNSLPADLKQLLLDSGKIWYDKFVELDTASIQESMAYIKDNNQNVTTLTSEQIKVWYDLVKKPVHDKWIEEYTAKGLPAQAVYDATLELIKQ